VIAEPPFDAGAVQLTLAWVFPALAVTLVGEPGGPAGVTEVESLDAELSSMIFVAFTEKVYPVPLVKPVTVHDVVFDVQVNPPGDEVTV